MFRSSILGLVLALAGCLNGGGDLDPANTTPGLGEPTIRIGVVQAATSVAIGSAGNFAIYAKGSILPLLTGQNAAATVTLESGTTTTSSFRVQVMCGNLTNVATRKAAAEQAGYPTYTEFVPTANCTRLYIGSLPSNATTAQKNALKAELIAKGLAGTDALVKLVSITVGVTQYRVTLGAQSRTSTVPVVLTADTRVTIAGAPYRGQAEVTRNSAGTLAGVNELPLEQYLYGVVPRELPPTVWPQLEAQKAQAVAARSYAIRGLGKRAADGYDLTATTSDQVYGGYASENAISTTAVDATRGIVPTYNGQPIDALFFSTSGGWTANNEDVFTSAPVAYLRGVRDHELGSADALLDDMRHVINPHQLRGGHMGDFEARQSPRFHRWTVDWTPDDISRAVTDFAKTLVPPFGGASVGRVLSIDVIERSDSARVKRIDYVTEAGTFSDAKDHVRSSLAYYDANGVKTNLPSTLFLIEPTRDPHTKEVSFTAYGGGWGHGVGMCQTGAAGMAEMGYTYDQILGRYYQQIALTQWY